MALDDLTSDLKKLTDTGKADVKLSTATRDQYLKLITDFRNGLGYYTDTGPHAHTEDVAEIGNVGTFESAQQTKRNLQTDILQFAQVMGDFDDYLNELLATVKKAADRLIHNG
jgi:hypothetical protein